MDEFDFEKYFINKEPIEEITVEEDETKTDKTGDDK